jgi:hypothetical protein
VPANNVGLLVYFRLGNKPLLVFVKGLGSLSVAMLAWKTPTSTPTVSDRGNLSGPWVTGWIFCALEFYISVLNRIKVSKISTVSVD